MGAEEKQSIKVIGKAMQILDLFTIEDPALTLNQITERLGQKKTTIYRILDTLVDLELLEKDEQSKQYHLGLGILKYSTVVLHHMKLRRIGTKYTSELSKLLGYTTNIGVLRDNSIVLIDVVRSIDLMRPMSSYMGFKDPIHCNAMGKIILACKTRMEAEAILEARKPLKKYTEKTIADKDVLLEELKKWRRLGYAIETEESMEGIQCIGMPIFDHSNNVIAAVSVSMSINNAKRDIDADIVDKMFQTAAGISVEMGCMNYYSTIESLKERRFD